MGIVLSGGRPPSRVTLHVPTKQAGKEGSRHIHRIHELPSSCSVYLLLLFLCGILRLALPHMPQFRSIADQALQRKDRNDGGQHRPYAFVALVSKARGRRMPKRDTKDNGHEEERRQFGETRERRKDAR